MIQATLYMSDTVFLGIHLNHAQKVVYDKMAKMSVSIMTTTTSSDDSRQRRDMDAIKCSTARGMFTWNVHVECSVTHAVVP